MYQPARLPGFTYIELIMVMGITMVIMSIVSVISMTNLTRSQTNAQIDFLLSDISTQQQLAANRVISGEGNQLYGVQFLEDAYVLFEGESYVADKNTNQQVALPIGMDISTINLPNQQIVFDQGTGFVKNWQAAQSGIVLSSPLGKTITITINRYGVIEITTNETT